MIKHIYSFGKVLLLKLVYCSVESINAFGIPRTEYGNKKHILTINNAFGKKYLLDSQNESLVSSLDLSDSEKETLKPDWGKKKRYK